MPTLAILAAFFPNANPTLNVRLTLPTLSTFPPLHPVHYLAGWLPFAAVMTVTTTSCHLSADDQNLSSTAAMMRVTAVRNHLLVARYHLF